MQIGRRLMVLPHGHEDRTVLIERGAIPIPLPDYGFTAYVHPDELAALEGGRDTKVDLAFEIANRVNGTLQQLDVGQERFECAEMIEEGERIVLRGRTARDAPTIHTLREFTEDDESEGSR